jgi:hypothetical protein
MQRQSAPSLTALPLAAFLISASWGCAPEPIYDDDLGLQAVSIEEGALAGTFGGKVSITNLSDMPVIGPTETGGETYYLMHRTWNGDDYELEVALCGGRTFPTPGGESTLPHSTYQAAEVVRQPDVIMDHDRGTYSMHEIIELWSMTDMPDPESTPLPATPEEALTEPHASRIVDADDDGQPGVTSHITGITEGDVYFVQRRWFAWEGLTLSADRIVGLASVERERTVIGSSNELLNQQLPEENHPDPKRRWFEERRLDDDADCDEVLAAIDDGRISRLTPF